MTVPYDSTPSRPVAFAMQVLPAIAYLGAVFYGGLIRLGPLPEVGFIATDKLLHTATFGGLALLLARAVRFSVPHASIFKCLWLGALGSSFLGALLEVCQAFVPYRSADPLDWLADSVGAALASSLMFALLRLVPKQAEG